MNKVEFLNELKQMRVLSRRGIVNNLTAKYSIIFAQLPPLECIAMNEYYIKGKSYIECGDRLGYSERQVRRFISKGLIMLLKKEL